MPPLPRRLALACAALLLAAAAPLDASAEVAAPDTLGPFAVGRTTFTAVDPARGDRELLVDVWYPVDPEDAVGGASRYALLPPVLVIDSEVALDGPPVSSARPFPLVIFSHGNGGIRFQSYFLTELLASHGFVVVAPDHTGNTLFDLLFGDPTPLDIVRSAFDRPADVSFLVSRMLARNADPQDPFFERLDPLRIGVTGHSFGGFTSLAVAGGFSGVEIAAEFGVELPPELVPVPADRRVLAIAPLAPASSPLSDAELGSIRIPTLLLGGTLDTTTEIDPEITRPFAKIASRELVRVDILDAGHFSFTNICDIAEILEARGAGDIVGGVDEACTPEFIPIGEAQRITNLYVAAFFQRHLVFDFAYQTYLLAAYAAASEPDVLFFRKQRPLPPELRDFFRTLYRR
jgi:predicted dienelactone hydrolase